MSKPIYLFIRALFVYVGTLKDLTMLQSLSLNGTWKLRWSDGQRGRLKYASSEETDEAKYIDAQVPGEVHMDVWKAGWIADPYVGINCLAARWVENCY
jgi:hypothetical protein